MGIRFSCPNGHKLNVKTSLAGKRALCPECGVKIQIPDVPESSAAAVAPGLAVATPATAAGNESHLAVTESASPSIVIALADNSAVKSKEAIPPPVTPVPPVPPPVASPVASTPSIPQSIVVPSQPAMVKPAPPLPPDVQYQMRRERNRRNQVRFAVALILMVIVLGIALVWVLWQNAASAPSGQNPPEKTGQINLSRSVADAATREALRSISRS